MTKQPNTTIQRFDFYDQIEVISANNYIADFPVHFHDTVCITMVSKGFECTRVEGNELINPVGGISLTNANEAHANPNLNDGDYSFVTYYLSPEVIQHFTNRQENHFPERVIRDNNLCNQLMSWKTTESSEQNECSFAPIIRYITQHYVSETPLVQIKSKNRQLDEIIHFMDVHWNRKLYLEELAKMTSQTKFAFLRSFKQKKGITPGQYLVIKRLEAAKRLLKRQLSNSAGCLRMWIF